MATIGNLVAFLGLDSASFTRNMTKAQRNTRLSTTRMNRDFQTMSRGATKSLNLLKSAMAGVGAGLGIVALVQGFRSAVRTSRDFAKGLSEVSAITGATGKDLEFIAEQAREVGRTTTKSAREALTAFKLIASAKPELLENSEALAAITKEAVTLAEATGLTLPQAADALTTALNQFQEGADQASRFVNVLAAGAQKGAAEVPELTEAVIKSGTVAHQAGIEFEELNGLLQRLAAFKTPIEQIGTSTRNILLILQKGADDTNPAIVGLTKALDNLGKENLSVAELTKRFGQQNVVVAQQMIQVAASAAQLAIDITGTSTAYEQAATQTDNFQGDLDRLKNSIEDLQIAFLKTEGTIRGATQELISAIRLVTENVDLVQTAIIGLGSGVAVGAILALTRALLSAKVAATGLNLVLGANPILRAATLVALLTTAILALRDHTSELVTVEEFHADVLDRLAGLRKDAATATDDETAAIRTKTDAIIEEIELELERERIFKKTQEARLAAARAMLKTFGTPIPLGLEEPIAEAARNIAEIEKVLDKAREVAAGRVETTAPPALPDAPGAVVPGGKDLKTRLTLEDELMDAVREQTVAARQHLDVVALTVQTNKERYEAELLFLEQTRQSLLETGQLTEENQAVLERGAAAAKLRLEESDPLLQRRMELIGSVATATERLAEFEVKLNEAVADGVLTRTEANEVLRRTKEQMGQVSAEQEALAHGMDLIDQALVGNMDTWQDWARFAIRAIEDVLRSLSQTDVDGIFDFLGSIFNSAVPVPGLGGGGSAPLGGLDTGPEAGFAHGGRPPLGQVSIVGESGPEFFKPDVAGTIIPAGDLGGGGAGNTTIIKADMRGASVEAVVRLENFVRRIDATLERRSVNALMTARGRAGNVAKAFGGF